MSSHHIVRDQQEPALLIHEFQDLPTAILHQLLEWSPTVVVCESALDLYTDLGHKIDLALVDPGQEEHWRAQLAHQFPFKLLAIRTEDALASGLMFLYKEKHQTVNLVTNENNLINQLNALSYWADQIDINWITPEGKYILCKSVFQKWLPANTRLKIHPLSESQQFQVSGAYEMEQSISQDYTFTSAKDGQIIIDSKDDKFLIKELW